MVEWLNDNSGAVQAVSAIVLALTLIAVAYYAKQTRKQAEASERMAREMEMARYAAAKPIIELVVRRFSPTPQPNLDSRLRNVGVGPAMSVEFEAAGGQTTRIGVLGAGGETSAYHHVLVTHIDGQQVASVRYQDVFDNCWETRYVGKIVGDQFQPLDVRVIKAGALT